jgi:hypothetical protein
MVKTLLERGQISDTEILEPEKNTYGFYFNVPYAAEFNDGDSLRKVAVVFYDDGTMMFFSQNLAGNGDGIPSDATELLTGKNNYNIIDYDNLADEGVFFSEDGKTVTDGYGNTYTAQGVEHSIYFGETYASKDGETFTPYASNTVIFGNNMGETTLEGWNAKGHYAQNYGIRIYVSIDGCVVYAGSRYDTEGLKAYYYAPKPQLKAPIISISNDVLSISSVAGAEQYEVYCENTLVTTTTELMVNLSQYVTSKNTYILVRAIGNEYNPSDFAFVKYGVQLVPGLYKTGAIALYETEGATAIEDMLITSWGELILDSFIIQEGTNLVEGSALLNGDLIIPNGVAAIGDGAFRDCQLITGVVLPDGLITIDIMAFYGCNKMSIVIMPDSVSTISDAAFVYCDSLTDVTIPDGITSLVQVFDGCDALNSVSLPASLTSIGVSTFSDCPKLESITFRGTVDQWNAIQLYTNPNIGH